MGSNAVCPVAPTTLYVDERIVSQRLAFVYAVSASRRCEYLVRHISYETAGGSDDSQESRALRSLLTASRCCVKRPGSSALYNGDWGKTGPRPADSDALSRQTTGNSTHTSRPPAMSAPAAQTPPAKVPRKPSCDCAAQHCQPPRDRVATNTTYLAFQRKPTGRDGVGGPTQLTTRVPAA